jgi:hypothetical protein
MREGNPAAGQAMLGRPARRFRLASPATALVLGGLILVLAAAQWPFAGLAHLSVNSGTGSPEWWTFAPFAVVGFVVAWRKPGNPLGWCLLGPAVATFVSDDGSFYAIAAYRIRPGTLPLGWVGMPAQPAWAVVIVLIGLTILIFPDGRRPSPRLRWVLWLYLAIGLVWMAAAYVLTVEAIVRHHIRVDSGGNLVNLDNGSASPPWWNVLQIRPGGATQATYDGHPLYTYAGDAAPGQAKGNGLNVLGGLWWEMTVSGAKPATGTTGGGGSSSTSSSSGGYGY